MRHREVLDHEGARGPPLGPKFVDGALVAGGEALGAGEVRYRRRELHSEDGHFCVLGSKNIGVLIRLRNHGLVVRLFLLLNHAPASFLGELDLKKTRSLAWFALVRFATWTRALSRSILTEAKLVRRWMRSARVSLSTLMQSPYVPYSRACWCLHWPTRTA